MDRITMIEGSNAAASQPAPTAQTSDGGKGNNVSIEGLTAMLNRGAQPTEEAPSKAPAQEADEAANPTEAPEQQSEPVEAEAVDQAPETQDGEPDAEAEAEPGSEDVLSQDDSKLDPHQQEKINKRIGKEVAKRKELEAKLAAAEARAQALEQAQQEQPPAVAPIVPNANNPLAHVSDVNSLVKEQQSVKAIKQWAEDGLDAVESGQQWVVEGKEYTKAELRTILRNSERTLSEHIPAQYQNLQARQHWAKQTEEQMPFVKDKTSPEYQMWQAAKRNYASILSLVPDGDYIAALATKGLRALEAEKAAAKKPAAKVAPPKPPASQAATPAAAVKARVTDDVARKRQVSAEMAEMQSKRNFDTDDVARLLIKRASINHR